MGAANPFYRVLLAKEFERRQGNNTRYSLRAFAKFLGLDATHLSKIIGGKQVLSVENAEKLSKLLALDEEIRREFVLSAAEEKRCNSVLKVAPDLTDCPADVKKLK